MIFLYLILVANLYATIFLYFYLKDLEEYELYNFEMELEEEKNF